MPKQTNEDSQKGHRERIRQRFLAGDKASLTDEALLELLLSYSIPQKDTRSLARKLVSAFKGLAGVLDAAPQELSKFDGIKGYSTALLKLVDFIRKKQPSEGKAVVRESKPDAKQVSLFDMPEGATIPPAKSGASPPVVVQPVEVPAKVEPGRKVLIMPERQVTLMGKAVLKDAIASLPTLPDTESLSEIRQFLRQHLHFNAQETRRRYSDYIVRRMFPYGYADKALRAFAAKYAGKQDLKEVCFYRFCKSEPLMLEVISKLLFPAIGSGMLQRQVLKDYLTERFPESKDIIDCAKAIVDALNAGGIARLENSLLNFGYRDISLPAFAFILHSEFPEPGMYDIAKLETNPAIQAMLWNPDRLLPDLYELRNRVIISKVSEIDSFRQFTIKYSLEEVVNLL